MPPEVISISESASGDASSHGLPAVMTAPEVAKLLRVALKTVYKYKDCDGLPAHQAIKGGAVRFYKHEVLVWMAKNSTTPKQERTAHGTDTESQ